MLKRCLELLPLFQPCDVLTLPIGPFDFHVDQTQESRRGLRSRFVEKLQHYLRVVQNAGFKLALEILPNSLIGDMNGFLDLFQELKSPNLGVNLDTGHAWNCGENVPSLPEKLKGRIFGLHLKDNQETDGSYGTPGTGSIALPHFLKNLTSGGYRGSLDLEINCKAEAVEREYKAGRQYLQNILYPTNVVEIPYRSHKQATRT
jgi:sugar phosphate isomerase/epimerase